MLNLVVHLEVTTTNQNIKIILWLKFSEVCDLLSSIQSKQERVFTVYVLYISHFLTWFLYPFFMRQDVCLSLPLHTAWTGSCPISSAHPDELSSWKISHPTESSANKTKGKQMDISFQSWIGTVCFHVLVAEATLKDTARSLVRYS